VNFRWFCSDLFKKGKTAGNFSKFCKTLSELYERLCDLVWFAASSIYEG